MSSEIDLCIESCQKCIQCCNDCIFAMSVLGDDMPDMKVGDCIRSCTECRQVCELCVLILSGSKSCQGKYTSPLLKRILNLCKVCCIECHNICVHHSHDHCQRCAEECIRCKKSCIACKRKLCN